MLPSPRQLPLLPVGTVVVHKDMPTLEGTVTGYESYESTHRGEIKTLYYNTVAWDIGGTGNFFTESLIRVECLCDSPWIFSEPQITSDTS